MDNCKVCGGPLTFLGSLGKLGWFRCRDCGMEFWGTESELEEVDQEEEMEYYADSELVGSPREDE